MLWPNPLDPAPCRFCGQPLQPPERLRGSVCRRLPCAMAAGRERVVDLRDADLARRRRRDTRHGQAPGLAEAPVVWLQNHGTRLVPLPEAERDKQARHLQGLVAELARARVAAAEDPPPAASEPLTEGLCTFCRGRCCRYGRGRHAFITAALLQRWLRHHPGAQPADAAADYLARLPQRHVENSCLHHGPAGCTLPREMRSEICNRYACDGLVSAELQVNEGAPHGLVAAMEGGAGVARAAWVQPGATRRLLRRFPASPASHDDTQPAPVAPPRAGTLALHADDAAEGHPAARRLRAGRPHPRPGPRAGPDAAPARHGLPRR
jgi:hypothetical protein